MITFLVLFVFLFMIIIDIMWIHPVQNKSIKNKEEQDIFFNSEVGFTMADGGEKIEKNDKVKKDSK